MYITSVNDSHCNNKMTRQAVVNQQKDLAMAKYNVQYFCKWFAL